MEPLAAAITLVFSFTLISDAELGFLQQHAVVE